MTVTAAANHPKFVDFKEIKAKVTFSEVLSRYGIFDLLQKNGDRLSGACPIHQGSNVTQFRVSVSKNCFNCFGSCGRGGNIIDFVSLMEDIPFRDAALLLKDWFFQNDEPVRSAHHAETESAESLDVSNKNKPLTFALKTLDTKHFYFDQRGVSPESIERFGLGFCKRGCLRDHIVLPIHNPGSEIVGYVGRWPQPTSESQPKYRFPKGFKKSLELFNIHRALQEPADHPLVLVEGFFDCIALWEAGIWKCVALMGSHLSESQAALLSEHFSDACAIEVLFDQDEAGRRGAEKVGEILADRFSIRRIDLPEDCMQPDHLDAETLTSLFE